MFKNSRISAFTLVELMVAMAIIAVLIGMSVFGISTAQRVLRDNQRRDNVKNIAAALNAAYANTYSYPSSIVSTNAGTSITVATSKVPATGILTVGTTTNSSATRYCYSLTTSGYKLGAKLEDGSWFNLGSASTLCSDTDAAVQ